MGGGDGTAELRGDKITRWDFRTAADGDDSVLSGEAGTAASGGASSPFAGLQTGPAQANIACDPPLCTTPVTLMRRVFVAAERWLFVQRFPGQRGGQGRLSHRRERGPQGCGGGSVEGQAYPGVALPLFCAVFLNVLLCLIFSASSESNFQAYVNTRHR